MPTYQVETEGGTYQVETGAAPPPEHPGYWQELWQQSGIPGLVKGLKEHPAATVASALGGILSLIKPGYDPVPESGHISVTEPSQIEQAADIAQRGPAAIAAAGTLGGLQIAGGELAPKLAKVPAKVAEVVHAPGTAKMTGGAAQIAAGAGSLAAGHPFVAADLGVRGIQMLKKGIQERGAAAQIAAEEQAAAARIAAVTGGHDIDFLSTLAGTDFLKLGPKMQAQIVQIANRLDKPVPSDLAAPPVRTRPFQRPPAYDPNATGETIGDVVRRETGTQRAPVTLPAAPESPALRGPVRPPLATRLQQAIESQPSAEAAPIESARPPARSLAQTEAAMAQKAPAPTEAPQSQFTATGERKSPQLRGAEIRNAKTAAKGQRFAQAISDFNEKYPDYAVSAEDLMNASGADRAKLTEVLQRTGFLAEGEKPPTTSIPHIVTGLKKLENAKVKPNVLAIAQQLFEEMKKSGTIGGGK